MQNPQVSLDALAVADGLARELAATAVARDQAGGHAAHERQRIRDSGLLALTVPREHGGLGADWPTFYAVVRRLAQADSALAHVFAFHHLQVATVLLYGQPEQQARWLGQTVREGWFWGNALNPLDKNTTATEWDGGFVFHGSKSYCSGSVGADRLLFSGWHEASQSNVVAAVDVRHPAVAVQADWNAFGQRQTDSGTVRFDQLRVPLADVLVAPGATLSPRATLRTLLSQLILTNLYLGIAQGAFEAAREQITRHSRPAPLSTASRAAEDPYVQHRFAGLWLLVKPAALVADEAARSLQQAFEVGEALSERQRGEVAVAVIEAKALAHRAALEVSSQLFELTGARATASPLGLDRFWRNARVHTLHDAIDHKHRDLGRYLLDGVVPAPGSYS